MTSQGGTAQCFWWGKIIRKLSSIIIWLHPKISTINNQYLSFPLFSELLASLFTDLLTYETWFLVPLFMSIRQFLFEVCWKPLIGPQKVSPSSDWLSPSLFVMLIYVWFWSSHDLGLTSRLTEREYLKTVTEFASEASLSFFFAKFFTISEAASKRFQDLKE